jgi:hypothetical protein
MTPEEFIDQVATLIAEGRDEEALEFGSKHREEMMAKLDNYQFLRVCGMMEGAQLAVDMLAAETEQRSAQRGQASVDRPA